MLVCGSSISFARTIREAAFLEDRMNLWVSLLATRRFSSTMSCTKAFLVQALNHLLILIMGFFQTLTLDRVPHPYPKQYQPPPSNFCTALL